MNPVFVLVSSLALTAFTTSVLAQSQLAAPYTYATRYNVGGQVTGTIAPDPDGPNSLAYKATRNTYGGETAGATRGLLIRVETGQLATWADESVAPDSWSGFSVYITRTFEYDAQGRKKAERLIGQDGVTVESLVQYSYDDWDRVSCKAVRMNRDLFATPSTSICVPSAAGVFGPDRITRYTYDSFGQVLTEERAVGTPLAQTYATNTYYGRGVLQTLTDAKGNRSSFEYYDTWRLKKRYYPSPYSPGSYNTSDYNEYNYDANGNVTFERKRGQTKTIDYEYDNNNRLVFKNLSDNTYSGDIVYDYDLRGLTLGSCFGVNKLDDDCDTPADGEGESNSFDGFGNLTTRRSSQAGVLRILTYQYDLEGNRKRMTHPDGWFFEYGFDGLNRVNSISESAAASPSAPTTALMSITYRPSGGRLDLIRPTGAITNIELDNALRLKTFKQDLTNTGNDLTNGFSYNPASQVTALTQSNTLYNYAEAQNRVGGYGVNGLNQYTQIDGQGTAYDAAGNLTSDGTGNTYTYDMENRLVAAGGATSSTLAYDTLGRLMRTSINGTTTSFHYDGDALIGEYVGTALQTRYVHGNLVDEPLVQYTLSNVGPSYRRYLHADHQGSVIAQSDGSGIAIGKNAYDPYGIAASTNSGRFGYTGQTWLKELGLNYYKARIYSPKLGRFLQTDPIFYADQMNLYAYVSNDPIGRTDPSGLESPCFAVTCGTPPDAPSLPQAVVDFSAGVGDMAWGATLGLISQTSGDEMRRGLGIDGGVTESSAYKWGVGAGLFGTFGLGKLVGGRAPQAAAVDGEAVTSHSRYPEAARHIDDAQAAGHPSVLTLNRPLGPANRRESLRGRPRAPRGQDRDEYPPAMTSEGGAGSSVRNINSSDNRGAGASIAAQCRGFANGSRIRFTTCP